MFNLATHYEEVKSKESGKKLHSGNYPSQAVRVHRCP